MTDRCRYPIQTDILYPVQRCRRRVSQKGQRCWQHRMTDIEAHRYSPDAMAMGDCRKCGHVADSLVHKQSMSDIEQALAEALREANRFGFAELLMDNGDKMVPADLAHYVKTYLIHTKPMQAIARQAAIGAAVEQLRMDAGHSWVAEGGSQPTMGPGDHEPVWTPQVDVRIYTDDDSLERVGSGPNLPAAVAAALEAE